MLAAGSAPRGRHSWEQQPHVHGSRAEVCVPSLRIPAWGPMANPRARIPESRRETASVQLQKEHTWLLLFFWGVLGCDKLGNSRGQTGASLGVFACPSCPTPPPSQPGQIPGLLFQLMTAGGWWAATHLRTSPWLGTSAAGCRHWGGSRLPPSPGEPGPSMAGPHHPPASLRWLFSRAVSQGTSLEFLAPRFP